MNKSTKTSEISQLMSKFGSRLVDKIYYFYYYFFYIAWS